MITYGETIEIIRTHARLVDLPTETIPLKDSVRRVCAKDHRSDLDIQPFDNAAMDGFAVCVNDLAHASPASPIFLRKAGTLGAGQTANKSLQSGSCWHVMTGAPIPHLSEAVVPIEETSQSGDVIQFTRPTSMMQHIRARGADFREGDILRVAGQTITPAAILPLATAGIGRVTVYKRPKVLFISTGNELVDDLSQPLQPGQIYNSNKFFARAFLDAMGCECHMAQTIPDQSARFLEVLQGAVQEGFDLIISSGAVSAGAYDFVKDGLLSHGAEILYHKIKLKPGKPNLLARLPNGTLYFGLPGNPVATAVGLRFFVHEALRAMLRQPEETPLHGVVDNASTKKAGLHMIMKAGLLIGGDGQLKATILGGQESFMVHPFLKMNGWVHLAEEVECVNQGDRVKVYPFLPDLWTW